MIVLKRDGWRVFKNQSPINGTPFEPHMFNLEQVTVARVVKVNESKPA